MISLRGRYDLKPLLDAIDLKDAVMLEIGVFKGESTTQFMESGKFRRYFGVDYWSADNYYDPAGDQFIHLIPEAEKEFDTLVLPKYPIVKMKMTSAEAAKYFKDGVFDFVYIDGNHNYESVVEDILLWCPKVRPGGYCGGHDFNMDGVRNAVTQCFGNMGMFQDSSWLWRKAL